MYTQTIQRIMLRCADATPDSERCWSELVSNLVSVIIPCYNRAVLLRQALASCALQTHRGFEVIVVDDGSEEDLRSAIDLARSDYGLGERLQYVRQQKRGGGSARNLGLRRAAGQFVQFLDSDDLLHPDKLKIQVAHLTMKPDLDMVFCLDEQFVETVGDIRVLWNVPGRPDVPEHLDRFLIEDTVWQTGSPLWRRSALERFGRWDEDLSCWQDWDFHVGVLCSGLRCECSDTILQYIRRHRGPRTQTLASLSKERDCFRAGKNACAHLSRNGLLNDAKKGLLLSYFVKHLIVLGEFSTAEAHGLRRELLGFMLGLALTWRRRMAIRTLWTLAGTPMFRVALTAYLVQTSYESPVSPLRDVVHAGFLPPPPAELNDIVRNRAVFSNS
jgi:glycosyltransferase involved in cell wall biosynthesis